MCQMLEKYFSLLNNKLDRVREAESLTLVQYNLIAEKKYDELLEKLERRAAVMSEFKKYTDELADMDTSAFTESDRTKAEAIESNISEIMKKIQNDNEKLRELVIKCKGECAEEIKRHHENKKGTMGYMQYGINAESKFFDKKS